MGHFGSSLARFAWTLARLAGRRASRTVNRQEAERRPPSVLDAASLAAERQMGETLRQLYRVGDQMQSTLVDTVGRAVNRTPDPGAVLLDSWENLDLSGTEPRGDR